jgi:iron complex transport system substrate-binding protein
VVISPVAPHNHAAAQSGTPQSSPQDLSRIASIGGDITEIIYALGVDARLVAVDATSQFPQAALKTHRNVGYMRALSTEGVLSVRPTLVIASERAGPAEVVKSLKATVPYVEISEGTSAESVPQKIEAVAAVLNVAERGRLLSQKVRTELDALAQQRSRIGKPLKALFVLNVQSGRVTVGGASTSADAIFRLAGLENAAQAVSGFKPVSDEALLAMKPDVIVVMARSSGQHDAEAALALPTLATSPAVRERRVIVMEGLLLLGFGPRVADAARQLMTSAYGDRAGRERALQ